ncbi:hypothetical protein SHLA_37c000080 [Shinella sp. DD12]|jgi:hypothetical protein|nr:hypothetical protein SHLA_37c000080 [Shinella sp. DD12]
MKRKIVLSGLSFAVFTSLSVLLSPLKAAPRELNPTLEPVQYIDLAREAFRTGRKEDATFVPYVGQLRYCA